MPEIKETNKKPINKRRRQTEGFMLKEYLGYDMEQQLYALRDKLREEERSKRGPMRGSRKKTSQQKTGGKP